jgi:lactoylglutathione lyase
MTQRLVGINHVALEVEDVARSLAFYGRLFELRLRGPASRDAAFIDIGDQFLALMRVDAASRDAVRHVGLVVEDKAATRRAVEELGAEIFPGHRLDFLDPDGNRIEVVQYDQIQFTKADGVMRGMGLELTKTDKALAELREKGLGG